MYSVVSNLRGEELSALIKITKHSKNLIVCMRLFNVPSYTLLAQDDM